MYDLDGQIVQFASGGSGYMPPKVKQYYDEMEVFADYIYKLPDISGVEHYKDHFPKIFRSEKSKVHYLSATSKFPKKGLYSYTTEDVNGHERSYKILSNPSKPITMSQIPEKIRNLPCMFKLDLKLSEYPKLITPNDIKKNL